MESSEEPTLNEGPGLVRAWAELTGAWAIAVALPVFQGATSGPDAFTRARMDRMDVLIFSLVVLLVVPTIIWLVETLVGAVSKRAGLIFQAGALGILFGLVLWQLLDQAGIAGIVAVPVLVLAAVAIGLFYLRGQFMRTMAGLLALATPVVFVSLWISTPGAAVLKGTPDLKGTTASNETPIVLMVLDEFPLASIENPGNRIDGRQFPNFARLAKEGTWYRNDLSVADVTTAALPSILASDRGGVTAAPALSGYPDNIFTLLKQAGYSVNADENVTDLCPHDLCTDRGSRLDRVSRILLNGTDDATPSPFDLMSKAVEPLREDANQLSPRPGKVASTFISNLDAESHHFSMVHLLLPHVPWNYLPDGKQYDAPLAPGIDISAGDTNDPWPSPQAEINTAFQREQLQLKFLDSQIGQVVRRMKALGTWDKSLFVVVADHGASFKEGLLRRHLDRGNKGWILPVPLFIKYPHQKIGRVDARRSTNLDVLPTILRVAGINSPDSLEGSPLTGPDHDPATVTANSSAEGTITLARDAVGKAHSRAVTDRLATFEKGSPWVLGSHGDLVGKSVGDVPGLNPVPTTFDPPWPAADINRGAGSVPAYVSGTVHTGSEDLVIALNGRIVGTTKSWEEDGVRKFAFTLPPQNFLRGTNHVSVHTAPGP